MSSPESFETPTTSAAIVDRDRETGDAGSGVDASSPKSHNSDSTTSSSDNHQGRSDNGEDGVMVSKESSIGGGDSDEVMVSEDAGREDMFVDASEDLGADGKESSAPYSPRGDSSDAEQQIDYRGLDNRMQNDYMVDEMERLRAMLDKTINEKDSIARECKDEIEMAGKAIANLRAQMRGLINDPQFPGGMGGHYHQQEMKDSEQRDTAYLHEMIHECSVLLKNVMEFQVQAEGAIKQLEADSHAKEQEIAELTVSRDVVDSYMSSVQTASLEVQFQKDLYIEDVANRMLASLASLVYAGELSDSSLPGKIAHIERNMFALLENYNWFLYETDQLRQQLIEVRPDLGEQTDYGIVFSAIRDELLGLKSKEVAFSDKLSHLDNECSNLMQQLEKHKADAETANLELEKVRAELEQEKNRYMNTKEKLSLAVTKGKALVQQRDSLKQNLAEKANELHECLASLEEKSGALVAAESIKEELLKSQISNASLQDVLSQREAVLEMLEGIMSECDIPEGVRSMDIMKKIQWIVDERSALKDVSHKFHTLADSLLSIDLPENFSLSDLESRLGWLRESYDEAKEEINALRGEINASREAARSDIDRLTSSLSSIQAEKDLLKAELDEMTLKYAETVEKEQQVSTEKEQVLRMLLEAAGIATGNEEGGSENPFDTAVLVQRCIGKLKEQSDSTTEISQATTEHLESMQALLYIKDQELVLCRQFLEEEMVDKSELNRLIDDLRKASKDLSLVKDERDNLRKDLERSEDKSSLIREKLSMAVKKGKGLVQDRENLKQLIEEKNAEIEKMKLELQQQVCTINDHVNHKNQLSAEVERIPQLEADLSSRNDQRDQLVNDIEEKNTEIVKLKLELQQQVSAVSDHINHKNKLSAEVERIPQLEADLTFLKDQSKQLENDMMTNNKLLQSIMELIDGIGLPPGLGSEKPLLKVERLVGFLNDCQAAKAIVDKELERAKMEVEASNSKLVAAESTIRSLEDALSVAEDNLSQISAERRILEVDKASIEEQLRGAIEESSSRYSMFTETLTARNSLEAALLVAETNISSIRKEKEDVEVSRTALEGELAKLKEEFSSLTEKLEESSEMIKSLENVSVQLEKSVASLTAERNDAETGREDAVSRLHKLNEEAVSGNQKLQDALSMVKSLEKALEASEHNLSGLENEKKSAESEILVLKTKLDECIEKLSGSHGNFNTRSHELYGHLKNVELLMTDEPIISFLRQCTERRFDGLKEMDKIFSNIRNHLSEMGIENSSLTKEAPSLSDLLADGMDKILNIETNDVNVEAAEAGDVTVYAKKIAENCQVRRRNIAERLSGFSSYEDEYTSIVLEELRATADRISPIIEQASLLKQQVNNLETDKQSLAVEMSSLNNDVLVLESVCRKAAEVMHIEVNKHFDEFNLTIDQQAETEDSDDGSRYGEIASELLSVSRKASLVIKEFQKSRSELASIVEEQKNELNETKASTSKAVEELKTELIETKAREEKAVDKLNLRENEVHRLEVDFNELQNSYHQVQDRLTEAIETAQRNGEESKLNKLKVHKLETDLVELQHLNDQLSLKVEELEAVEITLSSTEAEISSLRSTLSAKEQDIQSAFIWISRVKEILDMVNGVEYGSIKPADLEHLDYAYVKKLQNVINKLSDLQHQNELLYNEKEELLSSGLASQGHEKYVSDNQELDKVKSELLDLVLAVETLIQKFHGKDSSGDLKSVAPNELVAMLEKLVMGVIFESDNSKARAHELSSKLLDSQNAVEKLLSKVNVLENSLEARAAPSETIKERSIFDASLDPSASEISEIEEAGPVAKASIAPSPAAGLRTMRKGTSSDHITLDIASERLIDKKGLDEDKVHDFKSLNASGLVPVQGKMIADRVDGIWVSADRVLMSRPRARLGVIAYWLLLHLWLIGTIL